MHNTPAYLKSVKNKNLYIPTINTVTYGNKSLKFHCPVLWNDLFKKGYITVNENPSKNVSLQDIHCISHFNNILKKHFLFKYSLTE